MKTDREFLELAAKAAGYGVRFASDGACFRIDPEWCGEWSPRTNEGDALRLAVACGITVMPYPVYDEWPKHSVIASRKSLIDSRTEVVERYEDDACAATCRAIVRAAAAIGEAME